jgi:hypothetical protein
MYLKDDSKFLLLLGIAKTKVTQVAALIGDSHLTASTKSQRSDSRSRKLGTGTPDPGHFQVQTGPASSSHLVGFAGVAEAARLLKTKARAFERCPNCGKKNLSGDHQASPRRGATLGFSGRNLQRCRLPIRWLASPHRQSQRHAIVDARKTIL